jgi:hypothetical protein
MPRFEPFLQSVFAGIRERWTTSAQAAFDSLAAELPNEAEASFSSASTAALKDGAKAGLVFELGAVAGPLVLAEFMEQLLHVAPENTEVTVATVSGPKAVTSCVDTTPSRSSLQVLAYPLSPSARRNLREVRSYLFVRTPNAALAREYFSVVERLCQSFCIAARPLEDAEVLALLAPWCREPGAGSPMTACLSAEPGGHSGHPLQRLRFNEAIDIHSFECTHVRVLGRASQERLLRRCATQLRALQGEGSVAAERSRARILELTDAAGQGRPLAWTQMSTLLQGDALSVWQEVPKYALRLGEAGTGVSVAYPAKDTDKIKALPWLLTQKAALKCRHSGKTRPSPPDQVARVLALPWRVPAEWRAPLQPSTALWVRDHLRVPVLFDARQSGGVPNMLVLGAAAAGLTYLTNAMMAAHLCGGGHGWTLSCGGNPIFAAVHGTADIVLDAARPQSLNPLAGLLTEVDFEAQCSLLVAWLGAVAGLDEGGFADYEIYKSRHCLEFALTLAWQEARGQLGLEHVLERMSDPTVGGAEIVARIRQRLAGLSPEWFEGPSSLDETAPFLSIDISRVQGPGSNALLAQTVVVLHALSAARGDRSTPQLLIIDELEMLAGPGAPRVLEVVLRMARPNNDQVVLTCHPFSAHSTQQTALQKVVDENTPHKVLMSTGGWPVADWFARGPREVNIPVPRPGPRSSRNSSQFVWLTGAPSGPLLLELELDGALSPVLSAHSDQVRQFQQALEAGRNLDDALAASGVHYRPAEA